MNFFNKRPAVRGRNPNSPFIIRGDRKIREWKKKVEYNGNWLRNVRPIDSGSIRGLRDAFRPFQRDPGINFRDNCIR